MTCGLHTKLEAAYLAAREAFDEAHEKATLSDSDLNLLFVYYQGIKKLKDALPNHDHITFSVSDDALTFPDGTYNPDTLDLSDIDLGNMAAEPVTIGSGLQGAAGNDVITFS